MVAAPPTGRTFQARLTLAFVAVVAISLFAVSAIVVNRLDDYFREQEQAALDARGSVVARISALFAGTAAGNAPVVGAGNTLNPDVAQALGSDVFLAFLADQVALADVEIRIGGATSTSDGEVVVTPSDGGTFARALAAEPEPGQAREPISATDQFGPVQGGTLGDPWGIEAMLANPYTTRASTLGTITGLIAIAALGALFATLLISTYLAARFTRPLRRLGEATRRLAAGDLAGRVPIAEVESSYAEVADLARQFNVMAERLEESVDLIRRDRDRSRDFLADVSHELRTPLAALRMNTELLQGQAGSDPVTRAEFLANEPPAAGSPRLAGPQPARALEARVGPPPARPAARRPALDGGVGVRAGGAGGAAPGHRAGAAPPAGPAAHQARPAADRPGRGEPAGERHQVHARPAARSS